MAERKNDYKERLHRARNRRNGRDPMRLFLMAGCGVIAVLLLVVVVKLVRGGTFGIPAGPASARLAQETLPESVESEMETEAPTLSEEEIQRQQEEEEKKVMP